MSCNFMEYLANNHLCNNAMENLNFYMMVIAEYLSLKEKALGPLATA